jgi:uncharacterized protein
MICCKPLAARVFKKERRMSRITLGLILSILITTPSLAQRGGRGDMNPPDVPFLTVAGTGEVRVVPDEATVRLGVTRQAPAAQAAQEQVNEVAQGIRAAVLKLGITEEQIQTSQLSLHPVYAQQKPGVPEEPRIVAYQASNTVSVRVEKLGLAGPVIDAGLKAGANQLEGIQFGLRNELPARERALREAVMSARSKARAIADALDVRLREVLEVEEGGVSLRPPIIPFAMGGALSRAEAATPVSPGEVTVNASVTIRYRIDPAGR